MASLVLDEELVRSTAETLVKKVNTEVRELVNRIAAPASMDKDNNDFAAKLYDECKKYQEEFNSVRENFTLPFLQNVDGVVSLGDTLKKLEPIEVSRAASGVQKLDPMAGVDL